MKKYVIVENGSPLILQFSDKQIAENFCNQLNENRESKNKSKKSKTNEFKIYNYYTISEIEVN